MSHIGAVQSSAVRCSAVTTYLTSASCLTSYLSSSLGVIRLHALPATLAGPARERGKA